MISPQLWKPTKEHEKEFWVIFSLNPLLLPPHRNQSIDLQYRSINWPITDLLQIYTIGPKRVCRFIPNPNLSQNC